jgi:two-component SAPR family response regulator
MQKSKKILVIHSQLIVALDLKVLLQEDFDLCYAKKTDIDKILQADPQIIILEYNPFIKQKYTPDYLLDILNIPIILLTTYSNKDAHQLDLKYDYCIVLEPFTKEELTKVILKELKRFERKEVIDGKYIQS